MTELFFIAFPIATIIFAIALQKIFKSPILVAAIIFAVFDSTFLINTIIYTILAFITAFLVCVICRTNISCDDDLSIASGINNANETANTSNNNGCCNCNRNFNMTRCNRMFK